MLCPLKLFLLKISLQQTLQSLAVAGLAASHLVDSVIANK